MNSKKIDMLTAIIVLTNKHESLQQKQNYKKINKTKLKQEQKQK